MWYLIILLALAAVIAAAAHLLQRGSDDGEIKVATTCDTCNGADERCEQECMMEAATKPIEYFDDEELDRYAGRQDDGYTDEEADEFREVLYTMRQEEVADWSRSLILRNVNLPRQLRDEVIMLIGDTNR